MSKSILAIITHITARQDGKPSHPIVLPPDSTTPPGIWGGAGEGWPEHPIVLPPDGPPLVIWGDINVPTHPIVIPPNHTPVPPEVWPPSGKPTHPIAPGGSTGTPTHPIAPGGGPSHPIVFPPEIQHPIVIPPGVDLPDKFTVIVYHEESGKWVAVDFVPGGKPPTTGGPKH
jgi:hypothetical protein